MTHDTLLKSYDVTDLLQDDPKLTSTAGNEIARKEGVYTGDEVAYNLKKIDGRFILEVRQIMETHEI